MVGREGRTGETGRRRMRRERDHNRDRCCFKSRNVGLDQRTEVEGGTEGLTSRARGLTEQEGMVAGREGRAGPRRVLTKAGKSTPETGSWGLQGSERDGPRTQVEIKDTLKQG